MRLPSCWAPVAPKMMRVPTPPLTLRSLLPMPRARLPMRRATPLTLLALLRPIPLLTRAVFVVDKNDKVTYVEYVPEVTNHPDYDKAIAALKAAV